MMQQCLEHTWSTKFNKRAGNCPRAGCCCNPMGCSTRQPRVAPNYSIGLKQIEERIVEKNRSNRQFAADGGCLKIVPSLSTKRVGNISCPGVRKSSMDRFRDQFPWIIHKQPVLDDKRRAIVREYVPAEGNKFVPDP